MSVDGDTDEEHGVNEDEELEEGFFGGAGDSSQISELTRTGSASTSASSSSIKSLMETLSSKVEQLGSRIDSNEITVQGQLANMSIATQTAMAEQAMNMQEALNQQTLVVEDRFISTQHASDHRFQMLMESFGQRMDNMASAIKKRPGEDLPEGGPEKKASSAVPSPREPQ